MTMVAAHGYYYYQDDKDELLKVPMMINAIGFVELEIVDMVQGNHSTKRER
jgi:hypothetical protein